MSQMPPGQPMSYSQPPQQRSVGLSVTSLILGILSIPLCCLWFLSIPMAIVAIILGVIARGKVARGEAGGGGMATGGIICGVIGLLIWVVLFLLGHFGGPAIQQKLQQLQMKAQQKVDEEQRKQQERQNQGSSTQESFLQQELRARNLAIVMD